MIGTVVAAAGAAFIALGLSGGAIAAVGLGALGVFVGVVRARSGDRPTVHPVLGAPLAPLRGMTGTLAGENASRNPRRTSATASALMIGVALVAFITVFAASARASIAASIDNSMRGDWIVETAVRHGRTEPGRGRRRSTHCPRPEASRRCATRPATVDGSDVRASRPSTRRSRRRGRSARLRGRPARAGSQRPGGVQVDGRRRRA